MTDQLSLDIIHLARLNFEADRARLAIREGVMGAAALLRDWSRREDLELRRSFRPHGGVRLNFMGIEACCNRDQSTVVAIARWIAEVESLNAAMTARLLGSSGK